MTTDHKSILQNAVRLRQRRRGPNIVGARGRVAGEIAGNNGPCFHASFLESGFDALNVGGRIVAQQKGILAKETHDNVIRFAPPLVIDKETIDWALPSIREVLNMK